MLPPVTASSSWSVSSRTSIMSLPPADPIGARPPRTSFAWGVRKIPDVGREGCDPGHWFSVSLVRIKSGGFGWSAGPGIDDGMAADVVDASHDALLELV